MNMLPPLDMTQLQADLGYLLGSLHYTKLGGYHEGIFSKDFKDPRLDTPLKAFQARLEDIEKEIGERNACRPFAYEFLRPTQIPH